MSNPVLLPRSSLKNVLKASSVGTISKMNSMESQKNMHSKALCGIALQAVASYHLHAAKSHLLHQSSDTEICSKTEDPANSTRPQPQTPRLVIVPLHAESPMSPNPSKPLPRIVLSKASGHQAGCRAPSRTAPSKHCRSERRPGTKTSQDDAATCRAQERA